MGAKLLWGDGLRGAAATIVTLHHAVITYWPDASLSSADEDGTTHWFQYPIIRVILAPAYMLGVFFVLSGFVLSRRAIVLLYTESSPVPALAAVISAAIRRLTRLYPPVAASTLLSWLALELGLYDLSLAKWTEGSWWAKKYTPHHTQDNVFAQFWDAFGNTFSIWWDPEASIGYDTSQWTLSIELKGSFIVFVLLFATITSTPRFRIGFTLFASWFLFQGNESYLAAFPIGMTLAEWHVRRDIAAVTAPTERASPMPGGQPIARPRQPPKEPAFAIIAAIVAVSLLCASPTWNPERTWWSQALYNIGNKVLPITSSGAEPVRNAFGVIGAALLVVAIILSPSFAEEMFENPTMSLLGQLSFAMYLVHPIILFTVGVTTVEILRGLGFPLVVAFVVMLPIWWATTITFSMLLTDYVDGPTLKLQTWLGRQIRPFCYSTAEWWLEGTAKATPTSESPREIVFELDTKSRTPI